MKCKATIKFADDHGDNSYPFHCELEEGHEGAHRESGFNGGILYTLA